MVLHYIFFLNTRRAYIDFFSKLKTFIKESNQYGFMNLVKMYIKMGAAYHEKPDRVLVGEDNFGNRYWMSTKPTIIGRDRWVEYHGKRGGIKDASDVPFEWDQWLYGITDEPPTEAEKTGSYRAVGYLFEPNRTGEPSKQYFPAGHFFSKRRDTFGIAKAANPNKPQVPILEEFKNLEEEERKSKDELQKI